MTNGLVIAAFVVAAVCFVYSLAGLGQHETAKRGIWFGVGGMALAVIAQILAPGVANYWLMIPMMIVGAVIGYYVAKPVQMTEMPQLVAALHSFVGLAAVFIGLNAEAVLARVRGLTPESIATCRASTPSSRRRRRSRSRSCRSRSSSGSSSAR
jgi:H+-translocating NAD(P) transhydrogenase subunit beta